ncbi:MAG: 1-acyl-sn-glycerol-3-phosphate acyltransferase, partial [Pseudorhizobium sp.]
AAISYTRVYGMAMGRYQRPVAAWPGDIQLVPHLMGVLKAEAIDVEVCFGETIEFSAGGNRKLLSAVVAAQIRRMLFARLRGRDDS